MIVFCHLNIPISCLIKVYTNLVYITIIKEIKENIHEAKLAIVIGKKAKNIEEQDGNIS
jgi:2-keto-4-pentenoate hydratase/2-oxohepta-3-ene-1,7-dioic acid hydratase in catechol pathway